MERNTRVRQPPPNLPNKSLLLLGLQQLLNKSLSLPCAVVQPTSYNPIKSSCSPSKDGSSDSGSESDGPDKNEAQSNLRKRKRSATGDLSVVEKREKRKMMNRVAAQNARDRKKHYVEDLEKKVTLLEAQNKQLLRENQSLKEHTATLATEKQQLEQHLGSTLQADLRAIVKESLLESSGSAEEADSGSSPLAGMDGTQHDILASFFGEGCSPSPTLTCTSDMVTWGSHDTATKRTASEDADLVGGWPVQVEPPKELSLTDDVLNSGNPIEELCNINLDGILDSGDSDLEKLLQPFANSIVGTNSELDCWDIESLLATSV